MCTNTYVCLSCIFGLVPGTLPTEIGLLQGLEIFLVNENAFNGKVPSELGLLSNAELIQLDLNKFCTSGACL